MAWMGPVANLEGGPMRTLRRFVTLFVKAQRYGFTVWGALLAARSNTL
jgi:hypothetical protein